MAPQRDWFRVGRGWTDDEAIDTAGLAAAGLWTHLCCMADADGFFTEKAAKTRYRRFPDFKEAWDRLVETGLIYEEAPWAGTYRIKGWEKHQFALTGAERKALMRERDRADPTRVEARHSLERLGDLMRGRQ